MFGKCFRGEIVKLHSALAAMRGQLDSAEQLAGAQEREFRAMEERRSLNRLPADVLSFVFELSVSRLEEVAPLALVSKLFNTCVKRPNVLGGLELRTHAWMKNFFPGLEKDEGDEEFHLAKAAASAVLFTRLQQVWQAYPAIGRINLGNEDDLITYVADEHVRLVVSFPSLRSVSLARCASVTDISPLQSLTALTKLNLCYCNLISGSGFTCLSSLTSLQELNVRFTDINDEGLAGLSRMSPALTKLNLSWCRSISGSGFGCLSSLTSLQELDVSFTDIDDEGLEGLSRSLPNLTELNLSYCRSISEQGFACLSSLTSLQELDAGNTTINDEGLAVLSRSLPALTKLDLWSCSSISGSGFACLSSLTSLQEIEFGNTAVDDLLDY